MPFSSILGLPKWTRLVKKAETHDICLNGTTKRMVYTGVKVG